MSTGYNYGSDGAGSVSSGNTEINFSGANLYNGFIEGTVIDLPGGVVGPITIEGGTLVLWAGAYDNGSGFSGSGGLLQIYGTTMPGNPITNFTYGNTIDLASVPYSSAGTTSFNNTYDTLQINENSNSYTLQLDASGSGLTFALVPDGSGGTDIVEAVSVTTFLGNETYFNTLKGGVAISDTAANVYSNLAALEADASAIALIQATGGQVTVGNGLFVADAAALNKIVGGFTIVGQAPALQGNLSGLEADISNINSITALNGTITATVAQFLSDDAALNKVVGGFAISDTAANVYANLGALEAAPSHAITATGGQVTVGNGLFVADQAALNEIVSGFTIVGQASVLSSNLSGLETDISNINSITGLNGTITATVAQFLSDQPALDKIISGYNLDVTANGATDISSVVMNPSGPVGLIFDGTALVGDAIGMSGVGVAGQNITMTTQEYNFFSTITDGVGTTAANSTITFTNSGTVTANSNVDNYILAVTGDTLDNSTGDTLTITGGTSTLGAAGGGDAITIGTAGTLALGAHTSADTITFGTATSTGGVTGWNNAIDILKVSATGTGVVAASPVDVVYNISESDLGTNLTMGHVNFVTDFVHAGSEVAFYTNLSNYEANSYPGNGYGHLDTGTTGGNAILIVNDGTHAVDDVFYVVGTTSHGATSVTLIGTYDVATANFTSTILG